MGYEQGAVRLVFMENGQYFGKRTSRIHDSGFCEVLFCQKLSHHCEGETISDILVKFKDRSPIRRQRMCEGVWLTIALALFGADGERVLSAFIKSVFGIQDQRVGSGFRNTYTVIVTGNRSEVDDE